MSVASYPILKLKPRAICFIFLCSSFFFNVFLYIHEFANEIIFIHSSLGQRAISQLLFGTMFGSPGYMAAEI